MSALAEPTPTRPGSSAGNEAGETATPPPQDVFLANITVKCQDQTGVVAAVAQLLHGYGINILVTDQFTDSTTGMYFQRLKIDYTNMHVGPANVAVLEKAMNEMAGKYGMTWKISYGAKQKVVAILVSRDDHCLYDLLIRHRSGELDCEVAAIISNHDKLRPVAEMFGMPFRHLPIDKSLEGGKRVQELQIEAALEELKVDLVVLARYMQILTAEFCATWWARTINIHHSFLPAFQGARPYHKAYARGVKTIGATAHYATADLDAGPIIEQDVTRINHTDDVPDMIRKGRDLERLVLARAVRWHLNDCVLVHGNKTVIFAS